MHMSIVVNGQRAELRHGGREWIALVNGEVISTHSVAILALAAIVQAIQPRHGSSVPVSAVAVNS